MTRTKRKSSQTLLLGAHDHTVPTAILGSPSKRTMISGPYASNEPQVLLRLADHVVAGEPDEVFDRTAVDLERGCVKRLYVINDKPDIRKRPVPQEYTKFLLQILTRWSRNPPKLSMGITILLSGHHFIKYAQDVATELGAESRKVELELAAGTFGPAFGSAGYVGASRSTLAH